jgi:hypothetical protein
MGEGAAVRGLGGGGGLRKAVQGRGWSGWMVGLGWKGRAIGSAWIGVRRVVALSEAGSCRGAGVVRQGGAIQRPVHLAVAEAKGLAREDCGLWGPGVRAWVTYGCTYVRQYVAVAVRRAGRLAVWCDGMPDRRPACPPDQMSPAGSGHHAAWPEACVARPWWGAQG